MQAPLNKFCQGQGFFISDYIPLFNERFDRPMKYCGMLPQFTYQRNMKGCEYESVPIEGSNGKLTAFWIEIFYC